MELGKELREFWKDEQGVGVIELVLVLVVLIGLVIIFKKQITTLLQNIFKEINSQSKEDNNRTQIKDMIIVSPKGVINEELDQGDYFELVDMETESPDYHLYIKGRDMNQWMNQNGIRTKQLISGGRGQ